MAAELLATEEYYTEALRDAFTALAPAVIDAILSDVIDDSKAPPPDVFRRAIDDASLDVEVAKLAYQKLVEALNRAREQHRFAAPPLLALLHDGDRRGYTCAYSNAKCFGPANIVYLDHTPKLLLSCYPSPMEEEYIASLWHHSVSVAVSLEQLDDVWPDAPTQSRTFGAVLLTTLCKEEFTGKDWPKHIVKDAEEGVEGVTLRTVRLRHDSGDERNISVWNVPWPDFEVLTTPELAQVASQIRDANKAVPNSAIAIHCFGGKGRTGTLALTLALQGQRERPITLAAALRAFLQLRIQRRDTIEGGMQFFSAIQAASASTTATADT